MKTQITENLTIEALKTVNKYFIDLQNRFKLTPHEENVWKKVSKAIYNLENIN